MTATEEHTICFICAESEPLVPGHVVCSGCHALNGPCTRPGCHFVRPGQKRNRLARYVGVVPEYERDPNRVAVR